MFHYIFEQNINLAGWPKLFAFASQKVYKYVYYMYIVHKYTNIIHFVGDYFWERLKIHISQYFWCFTDVVVNLVDDKYVELFCNYFTKNNAK